MQATQRRDKAPNIWYPDTGDLKALAKCFIFIGVRNPGQKAIEDNALKFLFSGYYDRGRKNRR